MDPDAPRQEIVERLRAVATLIERRLPKQVPAGAFLLPWETVAPTLLARIAGQGRSIATLIEAGHETDAVIVMRSMLEHVTLFAWLAITLDDPSRQWKARNPDRNTEWWMVDQARREKKLTENRQQWLGIIDARMRESIRRGKEILKDIDTPPGPFPRVLEMAAENDARWGGKLAGWPDAQPQTLEFVSTARGNYWTLYTYGSSSTHPDYGTIRRFLRPLPYFNDTKAAVMPEIATGGVDVFASIAGFLLTSVTSVADAVLGWEIHVEAMTLLGRYDQAIAPRDLTRLIVMTVGERDGVMYGVSRGLRFAIEHRAGTVAMTVLRADRKWTRVEHPVGSARWTLTASDGSRVELGRDDDRRFGSEIAGRLEFLADADLTSLSRVRPDDWPPDV